MQEKSPSVLESVIVFLVTIVILALMMEFVLVFKNKDGRNYDIEMWKYSRSLKQISGNKDLGHEHKLSDSALLQNTELRINSLGMRGDEPSENPGYKVLILGSSITLGWGVEESKIYPEMLEQKLKASGKNITVYNAGIGNYNTVREVEAFFSKHKAIDPDLIVLSYFVNDAEIIPAPKRNWLLENSQLAVTLWSRLEQFKRKFGVEKSFEEHYQDIYADDYEGWQLVQEKFKKLAAYAKANQKRILVTMIPDIHNLENYPFGFIHQKIAALSQANGFEYIDFYDSFKGIKDPSTLWAMQGDPHPNELGHRLMSDQLFSYLVR